MTAPNDKRQLPFGESTAIKDPHTMLAVSKAMPDLLAALATDSDDFCQQYKAWIATTKLNTVKGLDLFPYACYANGTTEAFDKFYAKNSSRRLRCFRGEYVYHRLSWRNSWPNWMWLDDECLDTNDAIVISLPFSDTGGKHHLHEPLLERCTEMGIPVLVDCAYFGICAELDFNFTHPCITDIAFSLSKVFPVANARIGMRLSKQDDDDPLFVVNKIGYTNRIGSAIGTELIKQFSPDYIYETYRNTQLEFCKELGVEPSNCVLFGIGSEQWEQYNRGGKTNRLSFNKFLPIGKLYEER